MRCQPKYHILKNSTSADRSLESYENFSNENFSLNSIGFIAIKYRLRNLAHTQCKLLNR